MHKTLLLKYAAIRNAAPLSLSNHTQPPPPLLTHSKARTLTSEILNIQHTYACIINETLLMDPICEVVAYPHRIYERRVILDWIARNPTSPIDRRPLTKKQLVPPPIEFKCELNRYHVQKANQAGYYASLFKQQGFFKEAQQLNLFLEELQNRPPGTSNPVKNTHASQSLCQNIWAMCCGFR